AGDPRDFAESVRSVLEPLPRRREGRADPCQRALSRPGSSAGDASHRRPVPDSGSRARRLARGPRRAGGDYDVVRPNARARMKLLIQIPAYNEEGTIAKAIAALPKIVPGFTSVEILVVDDGSTDRTTELAKQAGATRIFRNTTNRGLAETFSNGLREA